MMNPIQLKTLAEAVNGSLNGDPNAVVTKITALEDADERALTFCLEPKYVEKAKQSNALAIITFESIGYKNEIIAKQPRAALYQVLTFVESQQSPKKQEALHGHPTESTFIKTSIAPTATIEKNAQIGHFSTIGPGSVIGENTEISTSVSIGKNVKIGKNCIIHPNCVIYDNISIGHNVIIHAGTVIGTDGFGYHIDQGELKKIPHIGTVIIEDHVEIGGNVCIDRGCLGKTIIKKGVKLDNLCHVAHNVSIGEHTAAASLVGFSGSCSVGKYVQIGGQAGIASVNIGDKALIAGQAGVLKNIKPGETVVGTPASPIKEDYKLRAFIKSLYKKSLRK